MKTRMMPLVILLFHGLAVLLFSQESTEPPGRSRGLLLGLSASNFTGPEISPTDNRFLPGLSFGFYQEFRFTPRYSLEAALLLSSKGSRLDAVGDLYLHQVLTYLELPVLGGLTLLEWEKASVRLSGGPFLGLKLLAFNEVGFPEEIQWLDVGVDVGLGMRFRSFSYRLDLKRGFLDVDQSALSLPCKNLTLSLLVGITF